MTAFGIQPCADSARRGTRARIAYVAGGALLLAAATLAAHGWSLADGAAFDDHWHQRGLREHGWSYAELLRTLEIEPAGWMHVWWQDKPVRWEYGRPLFILVMKLVYVVLGGNDPAALHALSVALHLAAALMVWRLGFWLANSRPWALVGGLAFVIYPHALVTVAWPSSQNCVIATALLLAALLAYLRASGLPAARQRTLAPAREGPEPPASARLASRAAGVARPPNAAGARVPTRATPTRAVGPAVVAPVRPLALAATIALWLAALLTRENSLLLAPILVALDLAFGGRRWVRARLGVYALLAGLGLAFVAWRSIAVASAMPDVYTRRPDGDAIGYALWAIAKLIHYLCTSVWIAPMTVGPTGRLNPWSEVPLDTWAMTGLLAAIALGYAVLARRMRGWWVWPAWIVLAVLPVVPVVATPHSGYLPGVGVALGLALIGAGAHGPSRHAARGVVAFYLVGMSLMTMLNRWQWQGMIAAERFTTAWVQADPPAAEVTDIYFVNLPFISVYAKPALDAALGPELRDVRFHVLTWAPDAIQVDHRTFIEPVDECGFIVRSEGQPYFAGFIGRFVHDAFRSGPFFCPGDVVTTDGFEARILEADAYGVWAIQFTFDRPLSDPRSCFYLASPECGAARLRFPEAAGPGAAGDPTAGQAACDGSTAASPGGAPAAVPTDWPAAELHAQLGSADFQTLAHTIAESLGAPIQNVLAARDLTPAQWAQAHAWWDRHVDADTFRVLWTRRDEFLPYIKAREEVHNQRRRLAEYIRSDLYLTGPPFPGPGKWGGRLRPPADRGNGHRGPLR